MLTQNDMTDIIACSLQAPLSYKGCLGVSQSTPRIAAQQTASLQHLPRAGRRDSWHCVHKFAFTYNRVCDTSAAHPPQGTPEELPQRLPNDVLPATQQ